MMAYQTANVLFQRLGIDLRVNAESPVQNQLGEILLAMMDRIEAMEKALDVEGLSPKLSEETFRGMMDSMNRVSAAQDRALAEYRKERGE